MSGILTGMWDLGTITYLLIELIIKHELVEKHIEGRLWIIFFSFAFLIGIPTLCYFYFFPPPPLPLPPTPQNQDGDLEMNDKNAINEPKSRLLILKEQFNDFTFFVQSRLYWALVFNITSFVVYASFFFPLVQIHMKWHGANEEQQISYLYLWSILLPTLGAFTSLISGFFIKFENKLTLVGFSLFQCLVIIVLMITCLIPNSPVWVQSISFICIIFYRMNCATLFNSVFPILYQGLSYGKPLGLVWSLSGVISSVLVPIMIGKVNDNIDNFWTIHLVICSFCILSTLILAFLFYFDVDESNGGKEKRLDDYLLLKNSSKSLVTPEYRKNFVYLD